MARTSGPFDYYDTPAAQIRSSVESPAQHATTLQELATELDLDAQRSRGQTSGLLPDLVADHPVTAAQTALSLAQQGLYASAVLNDFADEVDVFDREVDRLNTEVQQAGRVAHDGGLGELLTAPVGGAPALRATRAEELRPAYRRAKRRVEEAAETAARRLDKGVNAKTARRLFVDGLLPLSALSSFPMVELEGEDLYLAQAMERARELVPPWVLTQGPAAVDRYLTTHHDVASTLVHADGPDLGLSQLLLAPALGVVSPPDLRSLPAASRRMLALLMPGEFGNNPTAPFDMRIAANRVRISAQIHDDEQEYQRVMRIVEKNPRAVTDPEFRAEFERAMQIHQRGALYRDLLTQPGRVDVDGERTDHRQVLYFDPSGDGQMAELHGQIDKETKNIGVFVPGTTHSLDDWEKSANHSWGFLHESQDSAYVTWIGCDLPDTVAFDAPQTKYAIDGAQALADFSHQLRNEANAQGSKADLAMAGHSYGGAVLGQSQLHGLDADRLLFIAGAGTGPGVDSVSDLPTAQRDTPRYAMTAPGDAISLSQAFGPHGADPDTFGNTVQLQTGRFEDGTPIKGVSSHSDVFEKGSDAQQNMVGFFTGQTVDVRGEDTYHITAHGQLIRVPNYDSGGTVQVR